MGSPKIQMCAGYIGNTVRSISIQRDRNHTCKGKDAYKRISIQRYICFCTTWILVGSNHLTVEEIWD